MFMIGKMIHQVPVLTVWALSIDNLQRESDELTELYKVCDKELKRLGESPVVAENKVRIRYGL